MKLDIHELHARKLQWDDKIPDELRKIWMSNFELIQEISKIRFNRAVVRSDAVSRDIETIDMADANDNLVCCAIYVRFMCNLCAISREKWGIFVPTHLCAFKNSAKKYINTVHGTYGSHAKCCYWSCGESITRGELLEAYR